MMKALIAKLEDLVLNETSKKARSEWQESSLRAEEALFDYRGDHIKRVVATAKALAKETQADSEVITLAAWLHDIAKPGLENSKAHGEKSASIARQVLKREGVASETIERVCHAIESHVGLTLDKKLQSIEAQVLWDSDKLVKLGSIGILHGAMNRIRIEPGNYLEEIHKWLVEFIPLARKIVDSMNTKQGKKLAEERIAFLMEFTTHLEHELYLDMQMP